MKVSEGKWELWHQILYNQGASGTQRMAGKVISHSRESSLLVRFLLIMQDILQP